MIATLGTKVDLGGSYLWFKKSSTIEALFMIDALVSAHGGRYSTSRYGAYGNAQMTLDGSNNTPNPAIGVPTRIQ